MATVAWPGANGDLWQRLHHALLQGPERILISKVKGHAKWGHVERGIVTYQDKVSNAHADTLVGQGADMHGSLLVFEESALARTQASMHRQRLMLAILETRDRDFMDILECQRNRG